MNTVIAASKPVLAIKAVASPKAPATSVSMPFAPRPVVVPSKRVVVARATDTKDSVDVDKLVSDLQAKWDAVENKTSVAIYGGGALVFLWLSSTIVGAVNAVPLLPKFLELVGLGYSAWFVYRYLLFKSSREELITDVEELKKKITGGQ